MKAFEIFKSGKHTAGGGQTLTFSEADIEATVRAYDPAKHEAPLVVGHPKDNGPAYGWVGALNFADGAITVTTKQVDPEFAEMVQAGRFKKRSASFYAPDAPANPVPGVFYLRHVGFLGAQPPAVKGLKDVNFSDAEEGTVEFEEDAYVHGTIARLLRGLRDVLIEKFGSEAADKALPNYAIADLEANAKDLSRPASIPVFNEDTTMTPAEITALQNELATVKASNTELGAQLATATANFSELNTRVQASAKTTELAAIKSKIQVLVQAGKVLPHEVDSLAQFAQAQDDDALTFDFRESADKTEKVSARTLFLKQLDARTVIVDFNEASRPGPGSDEPLETVQRKLADQVRAGGAKKAGK